MPFIKPGRRQNRALNTCLLGLACCFSAAKAGPIITDFTNDYAATNWTTTRSKELASSVFQDNNLRPDWRQWIENRGDLGQIDQSETPDAISIVSGNTGPDGPGLPAIFSKIKFTTTAAATGSISFDWFYTTKDINSSAHWDSFGWLLNGDSTTLSTAARSAPESRQQSGTALFQVNAGDIFGFFAWSLDSFNGSSSTRIENFSAQSLDVGTVAEPTTLWLLGLGLISTAIVLGKS